MNEEQCWNQVLGFLTSSMVFSPLQHTSFMVISQIFVKEVERSLDINFKETKINKSPTHSNAVISRQQIIREMKRLIHANHRIGFRRLFWKQTQQ